MPTLAEPLRGSFNARMRDELLNTEVFASLEEAQVLVRHWRTDYNAHYPTRRLA